MRPLCSDSGYPAVWNFGLEDVPCLVKVSIRTGEVIPVVRHGKDDVFDFKIETTDIKEVSEEQIDLLQHGNSNNFQ